MTSLQIPLSPLIFHDAHANGKELSVYVSCGFIQLSESPAMTGNVEIMEALRQELEQSRVSVA